MKLFKKSEETGQGAVLESLRQKIPASGMPENIERIVNQEIDMLSNIGSASAEYAIGLTYIDYLVTMPWNRKTEDNLDIARAERVLDDAHYGLDKSKERIQEHLAVKSLRMSRRPRILVVDDEEIARKNLEHVLVREDYLVNTAVDGVDALRQMESAECDVIVTDLKMAGMDGMEVLEKIRLRFPSTMVIMVTGYATIQSAIEATKKGAFHYIAKPFKLDEVRSAVKGALEKRFRVRRATGYVLCFAGPPGTGKTSLGRSIARALGRKFARISLAGMKDEAEIRGHRRTYAGAMPGRIVDEIHRVESANPVMMLDEVDKLGHDFRGDPSSALLEVLDPEQNHSFVDHYLDVPFDLSSVMFILTANVTDNIPAPLRDRMEIIEFSGYTQEEKAVIAQRFIIPKQIREKGLADTPPVFTDEAVYKVIHEYTREAGIRNLERRIAGICRKIAKRLVGGEGDSAALKVTAGAVEEYLGRRKFYSEVVEGIDRIGVTTGLVRTAVGGDIIFIEAARMKGKKELIITGSLGDVMKESAQAALSYLRSNAESYGIQEDFFTHHDVHIHVPSGAIQKDGPSAGIAIAVALISLFTGRAARRDVAMTGEITLTGRVLPVGGIREKVLAARRAGVRIVIMPEKNRPEVEELPGEVKRSVETVLVSGIEEAADVALLK